MSPVVYRVLVKRYSARKLSWKSEFFEKYVLEGHNSVKSCRDLNYRKKGKSLKLRFLEVGR